MCFGKQGARSFILLDSDLALKLVDIVTVNMP